MEINVRQMVLILSFVSLICLAAGQNGRAVCYAPCGCFSDGDPFVGRPLPESPWEQEIIWQLYTRNNRIQPDSLTLPFNGSSIEIPPNFNPDVPTKFMIHGWGGSPDGILSDMKNAFLDKEDLNVILVDWRVGGGRDYYPLSASNTRVTGACSTYIARTLYGGNLDSTHCIGHSLGGQSCGYMGEYSDGQLGRISGLDPAGPWFESNSTDVHLDASDAQFVDVIHTNIEGAGALGLGKAIGHVDFYPNKGGRQPACGPIDSGCDHGMCMDYYLVSIQNTCQYPAFPCNDGDDADNCSCETCEEGVDCQLMGYDSNLYPGRGSFFLRTTENEPYCEEPGTGPCLQH